MAETKDKPEAKDKANTRSKANTRAKDSTKTDTRSKAESGSRSRNRAEAKTGDNDKSRSSRGKAESHAKSEGRAKSEGHAKSEGQSRSQTATKDRWENATGEDKKFLKQVGDKLSASTRRAKWISGQDQHQDHKGQSLATRNHDVIKQWAEERNAVPATVPGTEHENRLGVLRFNFPGYGGGNLQEVSWDQWFATFDERNLVFLYQENLKNGNQSNFFRFDNPFRENA
jgi:hypothetical protein